MVDNHLLSVNLPDGRMIFNVMYLRPIVEKITAVTYPDNTEPTTLSGKDSTHPSGNSSPTYTETSCTETSNSNSKESNTSCVTSAGAEGEKKSTPKKSPHKEKRESTARLYQHQIDEEDYPYTSEMLKRLNDALVEHEGKGLDHRFAMDKRKHQLTVNPEHLNEIEENLSTLGCYADDGDEYSYVFDRLIKLYNTRVCNSRTAKVNLAFLAGVNMPFVDRGMGSGDEYVKWVNEHVLEGE